MMYIACRERLKTERPNGRLQPKKLRMLNANQGTYIVEYRLSVAQCEISSGHPRASCAYSKVGYLSNTL